MENLHEMIVAAEWPWDRGKAIVMARDNQDYAAFPFILRALDDNASYGVLAFCDWLTVYVTQDAMYALATMGYREPTFLQRLWATAQQAPVHRFRTDAYIALGKLGELDFVELKERLWASDEDKDCYLNVCANCPKLMPHELVLAVLNDRRETFERRLNARGVLRDCCELPVRKRWFRDQYYIAEKYGSNTVRGSAR